MAVANGALVKFDQVSVGGVDGKLNGESIFRLTYATYDAPAAVETAGYFNSLRHLMNKGSIIDAVMSLGGTPVRKMYVVTAWDAVSVPVAIAVAATALG